VDEREQRKIRHRLAVLRHAEEATGNVSATCRYYSRPTFSVWLRRYEELGEDGLRDASSKPLHSPNATRTEVVGQSTNAGHRSHSARTSGAAAAARSSGYHASGPQSGWAPGTGLDQRPAPGAPDRG
jgi:hypothetical protein